ncbi:MAG: hypothetical protein IJ043_00850 [Clostridia bacterium]|nr:hypothetical protein [Clostridia bacterium]
MIIAFPIIPASAATITESEENDTYFYATQTADDNDNYGTISSTSDIDWWAIVFSQSGMVNFWLGNIPENCDYDLYLYHADGEALVASSNNVGNDQELIRAKVYAGLTYYIKIQAFDGYDASSSYWFRAKRYDQNAAKVFTYNTTSINSRATAAATCSLFSTMGYTAGEFLNNHAKAACTVIPQCDILIAHHLRDKGRMAFQDSYLYAYERTGIGSLDRCIESLGFEAMDGLELLVFGGDYTGLTDSTYGNLIDMAIVQGAKCCIGWTTDVNPGDVTIWLESFVNNLVSGITAEEALESANLAMDSRASNPNAIKAIYTGNSVSASIVLG